MRQCLAMFGVGLAISLGGVCPLLAQSALERLEQNLANPVTLNHAGPTSEPGYLGLFADDLPDGRAGVAIISVNRGGPAETAGLRAGDRIIAIGRQAVNSTADIAQALQNVAAGDQVEVVVATTSGRRIHEVTLGRRSNPGAATPPTTVERAPLPESLPAPVAVPEPSVEPSERAVGRAMLGVNVSPVNDQDRWRLPVRQGAVVRAVQAGSPADLAGLTVGTVVVAFDGRRVDSSADLIEQMRGTRPGQIVEISFYRGNQLLRRRIELAAADALSDSTSPQPSERSPLGLGGIADDLPALKRIEGVIEKFVPRVETETYPAGGEVESVRKQVETLQQQVERLQQRLDELERRLNSS